MSKNRTVEAQNRASTPRAPEPLTLEQLRGMDGEPVLLVFDFELEPMISLVEYAQDDDCIILTNNLGGRSKFYSDEELRECGIKVYAYPPVKLDGWTTHWVERERHAGGFHEETGRIVPAPGILSEEKATVLVDGRHKYKGLYCAKCGAAAADTFLDICPRCGRAATKEGLAMLERRLRG